MFSIDYDKELNLITLAGNLDSSRSDEAKSIFQLVQESVTVDMSNLEFICSSGIGTLVMAYSQLKAIGKSISFVNLKPHIRKVFEVSLLHKIFDIN